MKKIRLPTRQMQPTRKLAADQRRATQLVNLATIAEKSYLCSLPVISDGIVKQLPGATYWPISTLLRIDCTSAHLATECNILRHPGIYTLILAILLGPRAALLAGNSRLVHFFGLKEVANLLFLFRHTGQIQNHGIKTFFQLHDKLAKTGTFFAD
ncbi:MAG: hypothetical protein R6U97_05560 [Desulfosalsimonas sp.]